MPVHPVSHPERLYITDGDIVTHNTAFAVNIAEHVALNEGLPVAIFSMETGAAQPAVRIRGLIGRINQGHLRTGISWTDDEWLRLDRGDRAVAHRLAAHRRDAGSQAQRAARQCPLSARQCGKFRPDRGRLPVADERQQPGQRQPCDRLGEISRGLDAGRSCSVW